LLIALRRLSDAPDNRGYLDNVVDEFNDLGMQQGPVLAYAPFFNTLTSSTFD